MNDELKTKMQLISELDVLRKRVSELEDTDAVRQQSIEKIKDEEDSYRTLAENVPALIYRIFLRKNMNMTFFNDMLQTLTGYTAEEITHDDVCSIYHLLLPDDRAQVADTIEQTLINNRPFQVEYRLRHKDGSIRHFSEKGRPVFGNDGKPLVIDGVILDNTEFKLTGEALLETHERYKSLLETVSEWIWESDADGYYMYASPQVNKLLGYDPSLLLGKSIFDLIVPEEQATAKQIFKKAQAEKTDVRLEKRCRHADGRIMVLETVAAPFLDAENNLKGYRGIDRDIRDRKGEEQRMEIYSEILASLSDIESIPETMKSILAAIRTIKDFDALAVRLHDGEDYPYVALDGLPGHFADKEKVLVSRDGEGKPLKDEKGKLCADCICGVVLTGRANPQLPCFTKQGSFWTNSLSELLDSGMIKDEIVNLRDSCSVEGYESIALIPIQCGHEVCGLIQVLDSIKNALTPDMISFLEGIAEKIGRSLKRKRAESDTLDRCNRYTTLVETLRDWVWETDENFVITYANPQVRDVLGYEKDDLLFRPLFDFINDEEAKRLSSVFRDELPKGPVSNFEITFLKKDGQTACLETNAAPFTDDKGALKGFRGVSRDIAHHKGDEDNFRQLADRCPAGVYIAQNGVFKFINAAGAALVGHSPDELADKDIMHFVVPEDSDHVLKKAKASLRSGESAPYWFRIRNRDGNIRMLMGNVANISYAGTKSVVGAFLDMTEYRDMEDKTFTSLKLHNLGEISGGVEREMNNLLAGIRGYAEIARDNAAEEQMRQMLEQILFACKRGWDLLGRIRTISGADKVDKAAVDLNDLVRSAVDELSSSVPTSIEIRPFISDRQLAAHAHPDQVKQIVANLFANAVNAMKSSGGVLQVKLEGDEAENAARLTVTDTGHGIAAENLDRIFDPFFTTMTPGEGCGLGLTIVNALVSDLGGSIKVASEQGKGSAFTVTIPGAKAGAPKKAAKKDFPKGTERILFIDDNHEVAVLGDGILKSCGYKVTTEENSVAALETFRSDPGAFDIIIIDMTMPDLMGMDLARQIAQLSPEKPIILCKGHSEIIPEGEAKKAGIRGFIMKPLFRKELAATVRRVLDAKEED